jgi:hypothetical protein
VVSDGSGDDADDADAGGVTIDGYGDDAEVLVVPLTGAARGDCWSPLG